MVINIYSKLHVVGRDSVLAVCDRELVGKVLEEGKMRFKVEENFYKGELIDGKRLKQLLKEEGNINIVGERAVKVALGEGLINENDVIRIKGTPHVQIFRI